MLHQKIFFATMTEEDIVYALISNIPEFYHSSDLRNQFSEFTETFGFSCFHFRHRPHVEIRQPSVDSITNDCTSSKRKMCCVVKVYNNRFDSLVKRYHNKHWCDKNGDSIPLKCKINRLKIKSTDEILAQVYKTRSEQRNSIPNSEEITFDELQKLIELRPPPLMPNGNVGTPTKVFLDMIQACRLPSSIIGKLGLVFPRSRARRKYGSVPFDYGVGWVNYGDDDECDDEIVHTQDGQIISENFVSSAGSTSRCEAINGKMSCSESDSDNDDDRCEEWERHESLHNDVTQQERSKERLFEEEIELKWEKGGSGLVFYTDAQHWDELEGDFDEKTADDWDIDMSVYYEPGAGDKDARDHMMIREEKDKALENKLDQSHHAPRTTYQRPLNRSAGKSWKNSLKQKRNLLKMKGDLGEIGGFEKHTKGIGKRILEQQGWKEGQGVGKSVIGISEPIEDFGQCPSDKKGLGFRGEKLARFPTQRNRRERKEVHVGSVYINPVVSDPPVPPHRTDFHTRLSYRKEFLKAKNVS